MYVQNMGKVKKIEYEKLQKFKKNVGETKRAKVVLR